jgi:hypothetical protein
VLTSDRFNLVFKGPAAHRKETEIKAEAIALEKEFYGTDREATKKKVDV